MKREEFEAIQKEHMRLELRALRLQAQQRDLMENLIGQCVKWSDGCDGFITGTIVSCDGPRYLLMESNGVKHPVGLHMLRFVEKEAQDGN